MTLTIALVGGHGQIALLSTRILAERGHRVIGVIRNPAHAADVAAAGGTPVLADLERDHPEQLAAAIGAADALVFAAGAGPGSGSERKETVDYRGAILTQDAAALLGARLVQISYIGVERTPQDSAGADFLAYQRAKYAADLALAETELDWLILRPGTLNNEPATGSVTLTDGLQRGPVSRENVARVLAALLERPELTRRGLDLLDGDTPVAEAVAGVLPAS